MRSDPRVGLFSDPRSFRPTQICVQRCVKDCVQSLVHGCVQKRFQTPFQNRIHSHVQIRVSELRLEARSDSCSELRLEPRSGLCEEARAELRANSRWSVKKTTSLRLLATDSYLINSFRIRRKNPDFFFFFQKRV